MDSSFFFSSCAPAITFFALLCTICFMFYRRFRFHQENKIIAASSSSLSLSSPASSSLSRNRKYHVFPSFHGADVRKAFLSHILKEFRSKGIDPFIDNDIERSKSIGPELIEAIRGSRIAVILLSRNYASSSWCMNELVEIMKCRDEMGQIVMTIFYEVDPTDVKKQTGNFGKAFRKTCKGKTNEEIKKWRNALEMVATIAGEHSSNWDNDALMIEKIATDVSNMLNHSTPSRDFDCLVGMEAHKEKMESLMRLDLADEVRMIGIWGPSGIGKTTISRYIYSQISGSFQLSVFIENVKGLMYARPVCSDDYSEKLNIQNQFMSQIINHKDIDVPHLGVVQDRLKDKKVLIVLDNIDQLIQLDAIAKETWWFGLGSRIIITTQNQRLLKAHGINHMYNVGFPSEYEACQIFCVNAFGQKFPEEGFEELAWQVTKLLGKLPLGLRVMGSYFRGMSQEEWADALPRLRNRLDGNIENILKFSYDVLDNEEKDLFLYMACLLNGEPNGRVVEVVGKNFLNVRHSLRVLTEKSLLSMLSCDYPVRYVKITMHELLVKLGREIIRHEFGQKSVCEPGKRRFLVDAKDICEVLSDDRKGSRSVIGINLNLPEIDKDLDISERALERMSNLQFLRFHRPYRRYSEYSNELCSPLAVYYGDYLPPKLKLLEWECFPMTCLPSSFRTEHLVELTLRYSKLQKLWDGNQPLGNLKFLNLGCSKNLEELPDLSTATNLQYLCLTECSSLKELHLSDENVVNLQLLSLTESSSIVELPSSIGNATNLEILFLDMCTSLLELPSAIGNATSLKRLSLDKCTSLVELPSSIGNATSLEMLYLNGCTSLVELPSSIGNLHKLVSLNVNECSKLEVLPININLESLERLHCNNCVSLKSFPEISTNIRLLRLKGTPIKEVPPSIKSWSRFDMLEISYFENLQDFPHVLDKSIKLYLSDMDVQEIPSCVKRISRLQWIVLNGCKNLVSLPQLSDSLYLLQAENCESLEKLDCSFQNPYITLSFANSLKLNKEARELIIRNSCRRAVLPGGELPEHFTNRATNGSSMRVKLNQRPLSTTSRVKACISLVNKGVAEAGDENIVKVSCTITFKRNGFAFEVENRGNDDLPALLTEHLYMIEVATEETFAEVFFDFEVKSDKWGIGEGGIFVSLIKTNSKTEVD